jgi:hypothetical protein
MSSSVRFEPDGKQSPLINVSNSIAIIRIFRKTGCKCIGFHSGRDSMFDFSSFNRTISLVIPTVFAGSIKIALNQ